MRTPIILLLAFLLNGCAKHGRPPQPIVLDLPAPEPCSKEGPTVWADSLLIVTDSTLMQIVSGGNALRYPPRMLYAGRSGLVRVRFLVDTLGQVVPGSTLIEAYSDRVFVAWVCDALSQVRWAPILVGGRKAIVGFVHIPFEFKITPAH